MPMTVVDWQRPWLAPLIPFLPALPPARAGETGDDWPDAFDAAATRRALRNHRALPLHFVPQTTLPPEVAYETFISTTGGVPTRSNLHDFFNALVWLTYPASKAGLNALQATEIMRRLSPAVPGTHASGSRGVLRDRATIFDENAALLLTCDPARAELLRTHQWQPCLLHAREQFGQTWEVRLFGHALMEKLVTPYKAITAHVWVLPVPAAYFTLAAPAQTAAVDLLLSTRLQQGLLGSASTPLPVLGVPGWWPAQDDAFYADAAVFRPPRR